MAFSLGLSSLLVRQSLLALAVLILWKSPSLSVAHRVSTLICSTTYARIIPTKAHKFRKLSPSSVPCSEDGNYDEGEEITTNAPNTYYEQNSIRPGSPLRDPDIPRPSPPPTPSRVSKFRVKAPVPEIMLYSVSQINARPILPSSRTITRHPQHPVLLESKNSFSRSPITSTP